MDAVEFFGNNAHFCRGFEGQQPIERLSRRLAFVSRMEHQRGMDFDPLVARAHLFDIHGKGMRHQQLEKSRRFAQHDLLRRVVFIDVGTNGRHDLRFYRGEELSHLRLGEQQLGLVFARPVGRTLS